MVPSSPHLPDLASALKQYFGFEAFRPLQEEAVRSALEGRDVLVVMPTGAGKSLCFQLPAAVDTGLTLVISPLIALMRDQIEALNRNPAMRRIGCAGLHSMLDSEEQRSVIEQIREGQLRLLYIAPERFRSPSFLDALRGVKVSRLVVDEAHCISQWGHDFRPDYLEIKKVLDLVGRPPITAATATATPTVQADIVERLSLRSPDKIIGGFNRPNLRFAAYACKSEAERKEKLAKALPRMFGGGGSGIIYVGTRRLAEEVAEVADLALAPGGQKVVPYHAGMEKAVRNDAQNRWISGEAAVLVATNAFGMGIDKPDVRFVIHYGYPESIEAYYQEAGRAGRDGFRGQCVILFTAADKRLREYLIKNDAVTADDVATAHAQMVRRSSNGVAVIDREWWWQMLGWTETRARLAAGTLQRTGLVERLSETQQDTTWRLKSDEFLPGLKVKVAAELAEQQSERFRRLEEMIGYCRTPKCRRATILGYFGDHDTRSPAGHCCDNCETQKRQPDAVPARSKTFIPMPTRVDPSDIHSLLQALDAMRPKLGWTRLNKLLRGAAAADMSRFRENKHPLFGLYSESAERQIKAFLDALAGAGLMQDLADDEFTVAAVSPAGRECWQKKLPVKVRTPGSPAAAEEGGFVSSEAAAALYEQLKKWRRMQAQTEGKPPYGVFNDRCLNAITEEMPLTPEDLQAIPGMGKATMDRYGETILAMVRKSTKIGTQ